jgi:phosphoserine phosphatase
MPSTCCARSLHLVVFDLDGTLLEAQSSWGTVNRCFGNENRAEMELWRRGSIDYRELMRRDIFAWPKPIHISRVRQALSGWVLRPGVVDVVSALRDRDLDLAILSGGIQLLADEVAAQLGIAAPLANELVTDEGGYLTGEACMRVDPLRKEIALEGLCEARGIALDECVTVGDSEMDRSFLQASGLGILLGDERTGDALGVPSVSDLRALVDVVDRRR